MDAFSLAIQLVTTVQQISKFMRCIKGAPSEVERLAEILEQLQNHLEHARLLIQQQKSTQSSLPTSLEALTSALEQCQSKIQGLEHLVDKVKAYLATPHQALRSWGALKTILKKDEIQEAQSQIRDATTILHSAIVINTAISMTISIDEIRQNMRVTAATDCPQETIAQRTRTSLAIPAEMSQSASRELSMDTYIQYPPPLITKELVHTWYQGALGSVCIHTQRKHLSRASTSHTTKKKALVEVKTFKIAPSFLNHRFHLLRENKFGRISRSLKVYPVMDRDAPVFKLCRSGDLKGLQAAFSNGTTSPLVLDTHGWTLLQASTRNSTVLKDVCALLLQLGVDPNHTSDGYTRQLALYRVGLTSYRSIYKEDYLSRVDKSQEYINTLRILAEATQVATTAYDGIQHSQLPWCSLASVEMWLLHHSVWTGASEQEDAWVIQYAFMQVLNCCQGSRSDWEYLVRRLLRKGVDIHGCLRPRFTVWNIGMYSKHLNQLQGNSTPLDELFAIIQTPSESKDVADHWLDILRQEGYDIERYLRTEFELHVSDQQLTNLDPYGGSSRQLLFQFESKPSVSFEWFAGPECVVLLVWKEFCQMNQLSHSDRFIFDRMDGNYWKEEWPFCYSAWSLEHEPYENWREEYPQWRRCSKLIQIRTERRVEKKARKRARAQGHGIQRKIRGS